MTQPRPDTQAVLSTLKDFQRDTVDYAFARMYDADPPARRFLIADEVGLGKTMVARGIVAKAVDRLWDHVDRIDVVYICSNSNIARQNINRLNVTGRPDHRLPDRITMLPRDIRQIAKNKINFVSFTPGTSFQLKSSQGRAEERQLLYWLLPESWKANAAGAITALTGYSDRSRFEARVRDFSRLYSIDEALRQEFHRRLESPAASELPGRPSLEIRFRDLAARLGRRTELSPEERDERTAIVSELRSLLAGVCVQSLQPDLIILDEFQRFSDLLHGTDEASALARELFTFQDVRVLLLSATPYKMYAVGEESLTADHYTDLIQTVSFLQHDAARTGAFRDALGGYRKGLYQYPVDGGQLLRAQRAAVAHELKSVMVRTERLAVTADRSGMLAEVPNTNERVEAADIESFVRIQRVARSIGHSDVVEYWKSAPYLLNFMDDYKLKEDFASACERGLQVDVAKLCSSAPGFLVSRDDVEAFRPLDPGNMRMRSLAAETLGRGMWRMAWLPPSLPYYQPDGEFATSSGGAVPTKRLVFSAWQVVPKVVSALLSYEAERLMLGDEAGVPESFANRRVPLLRFSKSQDRLTGMAVLGLLYPSLTLATEVDPLQQRAEHDRLATLAETMERARLRCVELLAKLPAGPEEGRPDEAWYWAAPMLLDNLLLPGATAKWWGQADLAGRWRTTTDDDPEPPAANESEEEREDRWSDHVALARATIRQPDSLGRKPDDLAEVLALLAVASPAVCALRAMSRITGGPERRSEPELRNQAGWIAEGFRSLFNAPEFMALIRDSRSEETAVPYWRRVLEYSSRGCLQAVLDEYAHLLVEHAGVAGRTWPEIGEEVAETIATALRFRTANVPADSLEPDAGGHLKLSKSIRFRSRFAVRYGARAIDEGSQVQREMALRRAFNSPFWPFVLCSTSVGQEGLDFHLYCHAVVHWNLPSNPVDLEQREGRVHRYKGHAVRKNIATAHGASVLRAKTDGHADPWTALFEQARLNRPKHATPRDNEQQISELVPFWLYPIEGGARIERHVPLIPLSEDADRADALRRALAIYRMAFGQSRQEDLVKYLLAHIDADKVSSVVAEMCIDLAPPLSQQRHQSGAVAQPREADDLGTNGAGSLHALSDLLDAFGTLAKPKVHVSSEHLRSLLDDFAAAQMRAGHKRESLS